MKKILLAVAIAACIVSCHELGHKKDQKEHKKDTIKAESYHFLQIEGEDSVPSLQGDLLKIDCKKGDTLFLKRATEDDARKFLEEHGKG